MIRPRVLLGLLGLAVTAGCTSDLACHPWFGRRLAHHECMPVEQTCDQPMLEGEPMIAAPETLAVPAPEQVQKPPTPEPIHAPRPNTPAPMAPQAPYRPEGK